MKLLYPEFLYALGFLVIPILIHLFNFRKYKLIRFSQVRFLQDIQKQTQATSKLKHWLVLLSRLLAIIALVLAFCQPYFPNQNSTIVKGKKGVSIYLDNSFSMQGKAEDGQLFDLAKNKALAVLKSYSAADKFQLLTNDFEAKHQRWMNKSEFIEALQNVEISASFRKLTAVINRQDALFKNSQLIPRRYIISDLQKVSFNISQVEPLTEISLLPILSNDEQNIGLTNLEFTTPYRLKNQNEAIQFSTKNYGNKKVTDISVQLQLNNQLKSPLKIAIEAEDSLQQTVHFKSPKSGWQKGSIVLKDYPITFDDTLYFSYPIASEVKVLQLYDETKSKAVKQLFANDSFIVFTEQNSRNTDIQSLAEQNFIILNQLKEISSGMKDALISFVKNGGSLLLIPDAQMQTSSVNNLLLQLNVDQYRAYKKQANHLSKINTLAQLYDGVFEEKTDKIELPKVNSYWEMSNGSSVEKENLLEMRSRDAFLNQYKSEKGKVYLLAASLNEEESNFSRHAIFVPTLYNMALQSEDFTTPYYILNEDKIILSNIARSESPISIVGNEINFIPQQRWVANQIYLQLNNQIKKAGQYQLIQGDKEVGLISLNYNRKESDLKSFSPEVVKQLAQKNNLALKIFEKSDEGLTNELNTIEKGTPLWKYFIIFALIFLAMEVILLRILK